MVYTSGGVYVPVVECMYMYSAPWQHNTLSAHPEVHHSLYQRHWFICVLANNGRHSLGIAVAVWGD